MADEYLNKIGLRYYHDKIKGLIPTKVSQINNDSGFLANENMLVGTSSLSPWVTSATKNAWKQEGQGTGTTTPTDAVEPPVANSRMAVIADNTRGNKYLGHFYAGLSAGTYTLSAYFRTNQASDLDVVLGVYTTRFIYSQTAANFSSEGKWTRINYTFTVASDTFSSSFRFLIGASGGFDGKLWICAPMLNRGELKSYSEQLIIDGSSLVDSTVAASKISSVYGSSITNNSISDAKIVSVSGSKINQATDADFGVIKTNNSDGISLDANGQLVVDGRVGAEPGGGAVFTSPNGSQFVVSVDDNGQLVVTPIAES